MDKLMHNEPVCADCNFILPAVLFLARLYCVYLLRCEFCFLGLYVLILQERVALLGRIDLDEVPKFLKQGSIYLNTSLTEAFCISIIEAAAVGLVVVSTRVGGIPEVLPKDMMRLADPNANSLQAAVESAIDDVIRGDPSIPPPSECHDRIRAMYSWDNVAERTETAYNRALLNPVPSFRDLLMFKYRHCGFFSRVLMVSLVLLNFIIALLCRWFSPVQRPIHNEAKPCSVRKTARKNGTKRYVDHSKLS